MLDIVLSPNAVLLKKSLPCDFKKDNLDNLSNQMLEVMYHYNGVGLAGPQVGKLLRIIVMDCDYDIDDIEGTKNPIVLINPSIVDKSKETEESSEGCLSCPGISAPVIRHKWVRVKYFDLNQKEHIIEGEGLLSHCLQHEIDHLDGKTLFQTSLPEVRLQLLSEYEDAKKRGAKPGEVSSKLLASEMGYE